MHVEMSIEASGKWIYREKIQEELAQFIWMELAWDISEFDAWIGYARHWRGYPKMRSDLIDLRNELSRLFLITNITQQLQLQSMAGCLSDLHSLGLKSRALPRQLSLDIRSNSNVRLPRQFIRSLEQDAQILQLWDDLVLSGRMYGAQRLLSAELGIPLGYIRGLIKRSKSEG
jgi:hypothetical protein